MFNSVVLDVFIGLVLIYLLYSLFITIISEMIVTWMALRSRILRVAIEKMLNDGYHNTHAVKDFWSSTFGFIPRYFLKEFEDFKYSFAGKFYSNPSIKYLSDNGGEKAFFFSQTKPSYISADMFAETLLQLLKDKGNGVTDMEKVKFCLQFNTHHIEPATLKQIRDLAGNSGDDINTLKKKFVAWYNETMDRANGWYKRKVQLILFWLGFILAVIFNVDSIRIAKMLSKDKDARNELVSMGIELSKDSARYKDFLMRGDTLHAQAILDSGYAHITKDMNDANRTLGLGWGTDTLTCKLFSTFYKEDDTIQFKKLAAFIPASNTQERLADSIREILQKNYKRINSIQQQVKVFAIDTMRAVYQSGTASNSPQRDSIRRLLDSIRVVKSQNSLDSFNLKIASQNIKDTVALIPAITGTRPLTIDSLVYHQADKNSIALTGRRSLLWHEKVNYVLSNIFVPIRLSGLFITALMLSLGAPFWFDLLKKLVSIRGAGVKPEEKVRKNEPQKMDPFQPVVHEATNQLLQIDDSTGDVFEEALKLYTPLIRKIPGVKSVFSVVKNKIKKIQVNVDTDITKREVLSQFPKLTIGNVSLPQEVVVSGIPSSHQGLKGIISNKSGKNGTGSLGCVLNRTGTNFNHLLSCWHVMKGDFNYSRSDDERTIIDDEDKNELAVRWAGGIRDQFDYGLAICGPANTYTDNSFLKTKLGIPAGTKLDFRPVLKADADNQIPVKYYDNLNDIVVNGLIFTSSPEVDIDYIDQTRTLKDILILTNENENTISQEGNSGSIVFDSKNRAIAMIIGGDSNYSYAVKLSHIFSIHNEMSIV